MESNKCLMKKMYLFISNTAWFNFIIILEGCEEKGDILKDL